MDSNFCIRYSNDQKRRQWKNQQHGFQNLLAMATGSDIACRNAVKVILRKLDRMTCSRDSLGD